MIACCYLDWPSTELTADVWLPIHGISELAIHFYFNKRKLDTATTIHFSCEGLSLRRIRVGSALGELIYLLCS